MSDSSPLSVLLTDLLPGELAQGIEKEAVKVEALPVLRLLDDLPTPPTETDPNELIMQRFLYRGALCLILGPTGVGKSSFLMQLAIHFAVGQPLFGIAPGSAYHERGLRVLLIQAENDDGDLAEMRDGGLTVFATVGTGPQECVQISGEDRVGAVIMFRRFGESWQRARITDRVDSRLLLELV
ncbi:MAG: AAA family ATPase [Verrucomicrobiales bacterium]|nr:AAA family ATPase [Verrucomicrobiales bacterium]